GPRPQGSQGPRRRGTEARQGSDGEGRRRGRQEEAGGRRREGGAQVSRGGPGAKALRAHLKAPPSENRGLFQVISPTSFLIRLQGTGLVGLRCNAGVVRQRQVAACHQASGARPERQSPAEVWSRRAAAS